MKKLIFLALVFFGGYYLYKKVLILPSYKNEECFKRRFMESIKSDEKRKSFYAKLSSGASSGTSNGLVRMEKAALMMGNFLPKYRFDDRDKIYRDAGMSIMCANFVGSALIPEFAEKYSDGLASMEGYSFFSTTLARDDLNVALRDRGFVGLKEEAEKKLKQLNYAKTNCLTRHFLGVIAQAARLAPQQIEDANRKNLPSPTFLIRDFIDFHLKGLWVANWIDEKAISLQVKGLPIVCQDVPTSGRE